MPTATTQRSASRGRSADGKPNPVDVHVGSRVRLRRTLLGISQEKLGEAIGLTFQQVQKYECGANRIGSSRLYDLGRVLDVPVSFFFDDMPEQAAAASPARLAAADGIAHFSATAPDPLTRRETLELARHYHALPEDLRRSVYHLVKTMARPADAGPRPKPPSKGAAR